MRKQAYLIRPQAEMDLDRHVHTIALDNLEAGLRLYDLAAETYEKLSDLPYLGVSYHTDKPELASIRYIAIKEYSRYLVFYKPTGQTVEIIRVLHARMDKDSWL